MHEENFKMKSVVLTIQVPHKSKEACKKLKYSEMTENEGYKPGGDSASITQK